MKKPSEPRFHPAVGVMTGLAGSVGLALLWHFFGFASPVTQQGYFLTEYFTGCISLSYVALYAVASIALGWFSRSGWLVALGMILPLPIALVVEIALDPTSHNLLPFEIILYWFPGFAVAWGGAHLSRLIRVR